MAGKTRLLVISPWYEPAFKAGGVVRAVVNMVEALAGDLDISIVAGDRDYLDTEPYPGVEPNRWEARDGYRLMHLPPEPASYLRMARLVRESNWDVVHINGLFSPLYTTIPLAALRAMRPSKRPRVIVHPHGMFGEGALRIKWRKKQLFLGTARRGGLYRDVTWHATSALEADEIRAVLGDDVRIVIAANLPDRPRAAPPEARGKSPGEARICFFSRISPKKGLLEGIRYLSRSSAGPGVAFDVIGPVDDTDYWRECEQEIAQLKGRVAVRHLGAIEPREVHATLSRYHFMLLPTRNENFGYVILEALLAGCPVILSDQTPWRDLDEKSAGWVVPLGDEAGFVRALNAGIQMGAADFHRRSAAAYRYAVDAANDPAAVARLRDLLGRSWGAPNPT